MHSLVWRSHTKLKKPSAAKFVKKEQAEMEAERVSSQVSSIGEYTQERLEALKQK